MRRVWGAERAKLGVAEAALMMRFKFGIRGESFM